MLFRTLETVMICTGFKAFQLLYEGLCGRFSKFYKSEILGSIEWGMQVGNQIESASYTSNCNEVIFMVKINKEIIYAWLLMILFNPTILLQRAYFTDFFHKWIKILNVPFLLKKKKRKQMLINMGVFSLTYIVCYLLEIVLSIFTQLVNI